MAGGSVVMKTGWVLRSASRFTSGRSHIFTRHVAAQRAQNRASADRVKRQRSDQPAASDNGGAQRQHRR